jgi:hypothetical protein
MENAPSPNLIRRAARWSKPVTSESLDNNGPGIAQKESNCM